MLVLIGSVLTLTTQPLALTDGLAWLGRPLRRLHVPTDELALMVTIALRFIPTLLVEVDQIMRAQRARGADFGSGGPIKRAKALVPVLTPLFVLSFRRADELALAMEARCYRPGIVRTRLHPLKAGAADVVLLVVTAAVIAAGTARIGCRAWKRSRESWSRRPGGSTSPTRARPTAAGPGSPGTSAWRGCSRTRWRPCCASACA